MSKEVDAAVLEEGVAIEGTVETTETKAKKEKKVVTEEEVAARSNAVRIISESGVSPEMAQLLTLVPMWHDTDANSDAKDKVAEFFGGADKLKDFVDGPFQEQILEIEAFQSVGSTIKLINSFYKRREKTPGSTSKATRNISMDGVVYVVNKAFLESLDGQSNEDKKAALLAHPATKKFEDTEIESL